MRFLFTAMMLLAFIMCAGGTDVPRGDLRRGVTFPLPQLHHQHHTSTAEKDRKGDEVICRCRSSGAQEVFPV